jgi:hypothetical protein
MPKAQPVAPVEETVTDATLRAVIERLHPAVIDVAAAPGGLDIVVGDPVILDPAEQPAEALAASTATGPASPCCGEWRT